jgi:hypothetical protein
LGIGVKGCLFLKPSEKIHSRGDRVARKSIFFDSDCANFRVFGVQTREGQF